MRIGLQIGVPETLDSLEPIEIYDHTLNLKAAYVERYAHQNLSPEWVHAQGFYVLLSPIAVDNKFEAYIGKTDAGFARRLHAHNQQKTFWTLAILFKKDAATGFNTTQTNYLEGLLRHSLDSSPNVKVHNEAWTGDRSLHELDKPHMEQVLLSALRILFLRGYRKAHMGRITRELENNSTQTETSAPAPSTNENSEGTSTDVEKVFQSLKDWRTQVAREVKWSPGIVATNETLYALAEKNPQTVEELKHFKIPAKVVAEHHPTLLAILRK